MLGAIFKWITFFAFVALMLLLTWLFGGKGLTDYVRSYSWVETTCQIQSARLLIQKSRRDTQTGERDSTTYQVATLYAYEFDGKPYNNDRYGLSDLPTSSRARHADAVKHLKENRTLTCYVNPDNPNQSIIDRTLGAGLLFALIPIILLIIGVMIVASATLVGRREDPPRAR